MSDEQQPTSWRDRFFGPRPGATADEATAPADAPVTDDAAADGHSAEVAPDSAEVAATSVDEHDAHQPLVEHQDEAGTAHDRADEPAADTAVLDAQDAPAEHDGHDDRGDSPIEPTVIAPSTLRGPSHSAAHPDDSHAGDLHGDADGSSLEHVDEPGHDDATHGDAAAADAPPPLVEPRRPSFGLRRHSEPVDGEPAAAADADPYPATEPLDERVDGDRDEHRGGHGAAAGLAAGAAAGGVAAAAGRRREEREFVEPEPTQAMDAQPAAETRAMPAAGDGDTRVLDAQPEQRTERFGVVRDDRGPSTIPVDDETGRATAAGGTPIVLVEEPMPPRRKGARGVGFAVALLAAVIFAAIFAAAFFAVGYLFDRDFDATATLQELWLRPSYLLPVIVFFLAYWIITLLVNRAGWWAHVLGAFVVALLVYAAHIGGAYMEEQGGWASYTALPGIDPQELGQLLLAPLSVLAFVIAREVPVWFGGIVARRGRRAREWNRRAMDDFTNENAERLAEYERARS